MKIAPLATVDVAPTLPNALRKLRELAFNLVWSWQPDIAALFRSLDADLWEATGRNPARMLKEIAQRRLEEAAGSTAFLEHYDRGVAFLEHYLKDRSWFEQVCGHCPKQEIVYFSMEFGLTECLPVYSGGLGVLSGDHLKSASDLGLPLVGIGLAYRHGYFQQQLTAEGYQTEIYPANDFEMLPAEPVLDIDGTRLKVSLSFPGRTVRIAAWKVQVGRIPLYLLDTDLPENEPADRRITYMLYGGDKETRIQQEIVLGMGGVELVTKLGIEPTVCHMNEGHSAFIQLARIAYARRKLGLSPAEALTVISAGTVFTTHTPVPAGIDQFPSDLMDRYFGHLYATIGLNRDDLLALGSKQPGVSGQLFNMAILALRSSDYTNGVSRLHADVSRSLWEESWPTLPHDEIPIDHVTNGIHVRTWVSDEMSALFDRYLGAEWRRSPDHKDVWSKVREIPDEELWAAHLRGRERLIELCRRRASEFKARTTGVEAMPAETAAMLDPTALTIGFARRFATYKRATLLLRYPQRLLALLRNDECPLQIVFAGKAHPQDEPGKALIHDILYFARSEHVEHRLVFIENYDMAVARHLVQGVDVWLNTPRRPLEASGTSGMKLLPNGGLNLSILDGWWDEAYAPNLGWAIGRGRTYPDEKTQDDRDAQSLFDMLEKQLVPTFYDMQDGKLPRTWIARMKESMAELAPRFSSHRMIKEYCQDYYKPALERCHELSSDDCGAARELTAWKSRVQAAWKSARIERVDTQATQSVTAGSDVEIRASVALGELLPDDVEVQVYCGPLKPDGTIAFSSVTSLELAASESLPLYRGRLSFPESGRYGFTVRVIPAHPLLGNPLKLGLVHWASTTVAT